MSTYGERTRRFVEINAYAKHSSEDYRPPGPATWVLEVNGISLSKKAVADRLIRWAYRLDPSRPSVLDAPHGGWTIHVNNYPLAAISPGMIRDIR